MIYLLQHRAMDCTILSPIIYPVLFCDFCWPPSLSSKFLSLYVVLLYIVRSCQQVVMAIRSQESWTNVLGLRLRLRSFCIELLRILLGSLSLSHQSLSFDVNKHIRAGSVDFYRGRQTPHNITRSFKKSLSNALLSFIDLASLAELYLRTGSFTTILPSLPPSRSTLQL